MAVTIAKRWGRYVPWVLTLVAICFLYALTRNLKWSSLADSARHTPLWLWAASIGGFVLSHGLRAGRVRSEWHGRLHLTWRLSWAMTVRHAAWIVLAPLRTGEAIYVWTLNRQGGVDIKTATRSLIRLRLQDLAVLLLWTLMLAGPGPWLVRGMACAALLAIVMYFLPRWLQSQGVMRLLGESPRNVPLTAGSNVSWLYALSNWPVKFMALALPFQALTGLEVHSAWVAVTGGEWAGLMPVQPIAGYGVYEAGVVAGAHWMGPISIPEVAAGALFVHSLSLAVTLGSAWLARLLGWSHADLRGLTA